MKKTQRRVNVVRVLVSSFLAGLLASGAYVTPAFAGSGSSAGTMTAAALRQQACVGTQGAQKCSSEEKGDKTFYLFNTTSLTQVVDELGTAPTNGVLDSVELSTGPVDGSCYLLAYDSAAASGLGIGTGKELFPPLVASAIDTTKVGTQIFEWKRGKQFHRGLIVGLSATTCRATISWRRNGGSD